jgi:hypothetical protein
MAYEFFHTMGILSHWLKMDVLINMKMLKPSKLRMIKYGINEDLQAQVVDSIYCFNLEFRNAVLSRGMQH